MSKDDARNGISLWIKRLMQDAGAARRGVGPRSSQYGDRVGERPLKSLITSQKWCRRRTTGTPLWRHNYSLFHVRFEDRRLDAVALQQLVELGAIAAREFRRLSDAALGELEDAREVIALEALARVLERRHLVHLHLNGLLDEGLGNDLGRAQRDRLLDHVEELAHVAGPLRLDQQLERLRGERRLLAPIARCELG